MTFIVFLQNAWSPLYAGRSWPRESWLRALYRSRSGRRLRILFDAVDQEQAFRSCYNTTPIVGDKPSSKLPPDKNHIIDILEPLAAEHDLTVVACGRQAEDALRELWSGALLAVPHPAARLLTDALYYDASAWLKRQLEQHKLERVALRQRRGRVERETIPGWLG